MTTNEFLERRDVVPETFSGRITDDRQMSVRLRRDDVWQGTKECKEVLVGIQPTDIDEKGRRFRDAMSLAFGRWNRRIVDDAEHGVSALGDHVDPLAWN